ncbi:MAG: 16S rRNA (cytidine(1402)-2'-O)-methyltransferase [Chloroflexi bacterium]|nr:16S rRNA (cytidine(1402)-2'-O)-methyltransferase [Chloroflexota bacterium]
MPVLYVVATPIGNLEDITLRALRVLGEVGVIAAEDTRTTRRLLAKYSIRTPVTSYHQFSHPARVQSLVDVLERQDVALVSEAGMPGISDPGFTLVRAALRRGYTVTPVPGASAVVTALAISGLPTDQFVYLGFLPRRPAERRKALAALATESRTVVGFEAPHRLRKTLQDLATLLGQRPLVLCRELTKLYEEVYRGDAAGALEHFVQPRGEFTIVIGGCGLSSVAYWEAEGAPHVPDRHRKTR